MAARPRSHSPRANAPTGVGVLAHENDDEREREREREQEERPAERRQDELLVHILVSTCVLLI